MININLTLRNPWSDRFEHILARSGKITKNTAWEFEVYRCDSIAELETRFTIREDHAGVFIGVGIFSYVLKFQIYDSRHWNYTTKTWEVYE